jgi:hypothetical protein
MNVSWTRYSPLHFVANALRYRRFALFRTPRVRRIGGLDALCWGALFVLAEQRCESLSPVRD